MTKKQYPKLTISLKKEDEPQLLHIRHKLEKQYGCQFSLAEVIRHLLSDAYTADKVSVNDGR